MRFGSHAVGTGAGALSPDAAPNASEPPTDRVLATPETGTGAGLGLYGTAQGGTSLAVQAWVHDPGLGRWSRLGAPKTILADEVAEFGFGLPLGARVFPQITAVTGATRAGFAVGQR